MSNKPLTPTKITPATYFSEYVFIVDKDDDQFWVSLAREYVCACIQTSMEGKTIAQILKALTITGERGDLKSYKKYESFNKSDNPHIKRIAEFGDKPKLSVYKIIDQKLDAYLKHRNIELEKCYDFFCSDNIFETTIECWFKELYELVNKNVGKTMVCGDVVKPITYSYFVDELKKIPSGLNPTDKNRAIQNKISEQIKYYTQETDIRVYNRANFTKLKYSYYLEFGSTQNKSVKMFKVSPDCFAMLAQGSTVFCVIDDKEKTKRLFKQFKQFVATAPHYQPLKRVGFVGTICDMWWSGIWWWLKKNPEPSATSEYLTSVFRQNGFDITGEFTKTNDVLKILNENSKLDYHLGVDYDSTVSEKLIANGFELVRNHISHDYSLKKKDVVTTFVSFAGYPNDESNYALTQYKFTAKNNNLYGIKVGTNIETAEKVLEHFGYEKFAGNYVNHKVIVSLKTLHGEITKISIKLQSDYLGNKLF